MRMWGFMYWIGGLLRWLCLGRGVSGNLLFVKALGFIKERVLMARFNDKGD